MPAHVQRPPPRGLRASSRAGEPRPAGRSGLSRPTPTRYYYAMARVRPPSGEQIELRLGDQVVVVVEVGGGLRTYTLGGRDVVYGYGVDEICTAGRGQPLMPWPNRLEDGAYTFDGQQHQVALSEPAAHNAIHGLVRWAPWRVARARFAAGRDGPRAAAADRLALPARPGARVLRCRRAACGCGRPRRTWAPWPARSAPGRIRTCPRAAAPSTGTCCGCRRAACCGWAIAACRWAWTRSTARRSTSAPAARSASSCSTTASRSSRATRTASRTSSSHDPAGAVTRVWMDDTYRYAMVFTGDTTARHRASRHRRRADDLPAQRVAQRRRRGAAGAGCEHHERVGHRAGRPGNVGRVEARRDGRATASVRGLRRAAGRGQRGARGQRPPAPPHRAVQRLRDVARAVRGAGAAAPPRRQHVPAVVKRCAAAAATATAARTSQVRT